MRILLQHTESKLYLRSMNVWTDNPYLAFDFVHSQRAIDFVRMHHVQNVQLVVKFFDPRWDEIVPLPEFQPAVAA